MDVVVKFFASYRKLVGLRQTTVALAADATVADLVEQVLEAHPQLRGEQASMLFAVNQEFADAKARLRAGDEVALLPPVSGGADLCRIQEGPVDATALVASVSDDRAGAIVLFLGTVRADPGVKALDYEAYDAMAVKEMEGLRSAAKERFGVTEMAIVHRTGRLPVGETSVAVACSAPHRQEAFRACEWAMEELKRIVPIWKTERA